MSNNIEPMTFVPKKPRGVFGVQESGKPPCIWQRDLANCLPLIVRNAVITVQLMYQEDADAMTALDTVAQMTCKFYEACRNDNITGITNMNRLLEFIKEKDINKEVYGAFCSMFFISAFAFLFAGKEMSVAIPEGLNQDAYDFHIFLQMWSMLPQDKAKDFLAEVRSNGCLNNLINLSKLVRPSEDYLKSIQRAQVELLRTMFKKGPEDEVAED